MVVRRAGDLLDALLDPARAVAVGERIDDLLERGGRGLVVVEAQERVRLLLEEAGDARLVLGPLDDRRLGVLAERGGDAAVEQLEGGRLLLGVEIAEGRRHGVALVAVDDPPLEHELGERGDDVVRELEVAEAGVLHEALDLLAQPLVPVAEAEGVLLAGVLQLLA